MLTALNQVRSVNLLRCTEVFYPAHIFFCPVPWFLVYIPGQVVMQLLTTAVPGSFWMAICKGMETSRCLCISVYLKNSQKAPDTSSGDTLNALHCIAS